MNVEKSERREASRHRARRGMRVTGRSVFVVAAARAKRDAETLKAGRTARRTPGGK